MTLAITDPSAGFTDASSAPDGLAIHSPQHAPELIGSIASFKIGRRRLRFLTRDPRRLATACTRDLSDFLVDQRLNVAGSTIRELGSALEQELAVRAGEFVGAVERARFGPPAPARAAAIAARRELRELKGHVRRRLGTLDRVRGFVSLRSLGVS